MMIRRYMERSLVFIRIKYTYLNPTNCGEVAVVRLTSFDFIRFSRLVAGDTNLKSPLIGLKRRNSSIFF